MRPLLVAVVLWQSLLADSPVAHAQSLAEWDVMIYMDGDNNLEPYALLDFQEMASVQATPGVNILVQFDRPVHGGNASPSDWSDTRRFVIAPGMQPLLGSSVAEFAGERDMGDPDTLAQFVAWALSAYPAERTLLIVWSHGSGWRFHSANASRAHVAREMDHLTQAHLTAGEGYGPLPTSDVEFAAPVNRSACYDASSGGEMPVSGIAPALYPVLQGRRLDLIGFDSCLMGTIEVAHALRGVASYFVASENTEPLIGWAYDRWLDTLRLNPEMGPVELGLAMLASYRVDVAAASTLALVDLEVVDALSDELDRVASACEENDACLRHVVGEARRGMAVWEASGTSVDLVELLARIERMSGASAAQSSACQAASARAGTCIIDHYTAPGIRDKDGRMLVGSGLSIFFPEDDEFMDDYMFTLGSQPFVATHRWDEFLSLALAWEADDR